MMRIHVENSSFDHHEPEISLIKGGPGPSTGGTPLDQSGDPPPPGGECFALNHENSSKCIKTHSYEFLMTPRHHWNDFQSISRTSTFHDFHDF